MDERAARRIWHAVERVHAVVYFAPEVRAALDAAGLRGFWRGYFAARAAPLGRVGPEVVTAVAFGFHPAMVARAVPDVWSRCPPERALVARRVGAVAALERLAGDVPADEVAGAAAAAEAAVGRLEVAGRALAAANRALPPATGPWERLWQACTTVREHRGDGHVAALVAAGLDGVEGHVLQVATSPVTREAVQPHRGWSDGDWEAGAARLVARGWIEPEGRATGAGDRAKVGIEEATDRAAALAWAAHDDERDLLGHVAGRIGRALDEAGLIPYPNPMGLPAPQPRPARVASRGEVRGR